MISCVIETETKNSEQGARTDEKASRAMQYHEPVMVQEVLDLLQPRAGDVILDANVGTGGHALALLQACGGRGRLVGLDLDPEMLSKALTRFRTSGFPSSCYDLVQANHSDLARVMGDLGLDAVHRIIFD